MKKLSLLIITLTLSGIITAAGSGPSGGSPGQKPLTGNALWDTFMAKKDEEAARTREELSKKEADPYKINSKELEEFFQVFKKKEGSDESFSFSFEDYESFKDFLTKSYAANQSGDLITRIIKSVPEEIICLIDRKKLIFALNEVNLLYTVKHIRITPDVFTNLVVKILKKIAYSEEGEVFSLV